MNVKMACHRRERFEELDAHEAGTVAKKKKKEKSLQTFFFWQHDRVLWIFSVGLQLLFN